MKHLHLAISLLLLSACTKQLPYEYEVKEHVHAKTEIDTQAEYIYVPSLTNSSRTSGAARPYWMGEQKIVQFRFTEGKLQVLEKETDERFQDNSANSKLVMEIPITHLEYRCALDKYKECTNKEEKNSEMHWSQRSQFQPNFDQISISEANILPIEMEKLFGGNCYTQVASRFSGYKIEKDAINFQIEKTFRADLRCLQSLESLSDLTVTGVYHYSFAKLESLQSKNYQPLAYYTEDQNTFGFFTTETKKLDVDHSDTIHSQKSFMNRWDPNRKVITYLLSSEFFKKENEGLRLATLKAFDKINKGLEAAGIQFRLEAKDGTGKEVGDIRNSFIVMVEDPIDAGLLGYGPSVANPKTGEILSARTVMYPGVMKQFVRWTYDQIVAESKLSEKQVDKLEGFKLSASLQGQLASLVKKSESDKPATIGEQTKALSQNQLLPDSGRLDLNLPSIKSEIVGKKMARQMTLSAEDRIGLMSKHCTYPAELFNFEHIVGKSIHTHFKGQLKPWEHLSDSEKQDVINIVLPEVWISTLIHEIGHNLGLRHNFKGSEDKANFYSKEELAAEGVNQQIPYSSVMDYAYSDLNSLPSLGKYDIAALRFGYARKVENEKGELVDVKNSISELTEQKLKEYAYCTDEHVEVNVGCKRFDEGTNFTEMVKHEIKSYEEMYKRRNFRNLRRNFSLMSDGAVADRLLQSLSYLRFNFETMSRLKDRFQVDYDSPEWDSVEFLKDLKQASGLAAEFLLKVLKEPPTTCVVANSAKKEIIAVVALDQINREEISCAALKLREGLEVVAEIGKSVNSKKDPQSNNPYMDQIDIRGSWISKLASAKVLFDRRIDNSSFDRTDDNFLDFHPAREMLMKGIMEIVNGASVQVQEVTLKNGQKIQLPVTIDYTQSHIITSPLSDSVKRKLGLPARDVRIQEILIPIVKQSAKAVRFIDNQNDRIIFDSLSVEKISALTQVNRHGPDGKELKLAILKNGDYQYIATERNKIAAELIGKANIAGKLSPLNPDDVEKALEKLVKGELKDLDKASPVEKIVAEVGLENVLAFYQGEIKSSDYMLSMLEVLTR